MASLKNKTLTPEQKAKLKRIMNDGVKVLQEVKDLNEGLRDTVKAVAEEIEIKPSVLSRAIKSAFKDDLNDQREDMDDIEELLMIGGNVSGSSNP